MWNVNFSLQRLSDIICLEHSLSVIEKKKPSERVKRTTYPEKKSFRDDIREAIDQILKEGSAKDFDELLYKLEDAGYEIKRGKHISLKGKEQKRFIRLRSLGDGYTDEDFKKILAGEMEHAFYDNEKAEKQPKTYQRKKERICDTKICGRKNISIHHGVAFVYSNSNKFQDGLNAFNDRVTKVLILHIEDYLTKLGIDMG